MEGTVAERESETTHAVAPRHSATARQMADALGAHNVLDDAKPAGWMLSQPQTINGTALHLSPDGRLSQRVLCCRIDEKPAVKATAISR